MLGFIMSVITYGALFVGVPLIIFLAVRERNDDDEY